MGLDQSAKGAKGYKAWHWGYAPKRKIKFKNPHLPNNLQLVEAGQLTDFHIEPMPGLKLRKVRTNSLDKEAARMGNEPDDLMVISVEAEDYPNNHLGFDPNHPYQRLYTVLSPSVRRDLKRVAWRKNGRTYPLKDIAAMIGGKHASGGYPDVRPRAGAEVP